MAEKEIREQIARLRCKGCRRVPTAEEVREMYASFGHTLVSSPLAKGEVLIWQCLACKERAEAARIIYTGRLS